MLLITGGKWIEGLPQDLKTLSEPLLFSLSPMGCLVIALIIAMYFFLTKRKSGRDFYAVGDNLQGALQLGVHIDIVRVSAFAINGLMAAIAGIVFTSQIGFVPQFNGERIRNESYCRFVY